MKSRIDLFNTSFILHCDEDNEYIQSLVAYIRSKVDAIQDDVEIEDPLKQAILTLLLLAHELKLVNNDYNQQSNYAINSVKKLVSLLEPSNTAHNPQRQTLDYANQKQDSLQNWGWD